MLKNRIIVFAVVALSIHALWIVASHLAVVSFANERSGAGRASANATLDAPDTFKVLKHRGEKFITCSGFENCSGTAVQSCPYKSSDGPFQQVLDANSYDVYTAEGAKRTFVTRADFKSISDIVSGSKDVEGTIANQLSKSESQVELRVKENVEKSIIDALNKIPQKVLSEEAAKAIKEAVLFDIREDLKKINEEIEKLKKQ